MICKPVHLFLSLLTATTLLAGDNDQSAGMGKPPSLDELAGDWLESSAVLSAPAVNSPLGAGKVTLGQNLMGIEHLSFPPVVAVASTALQVNGQAPAVDRVRWFPYQVIREGKVNGLQATSTIRLHYRQQAVLYTLKLTNPGAAELPANIRIACQAGSSKHEAWAWNVPGLKKDASFQIAADDGVLICTDSRARLTNAFAFSKKPDELTVEKGHGIAHWRGRLAPGASKEFHLVLAIGRHDDDALSLAKSCARDFPAVFDEVKTNWQQTFTAMFTPRNGFFSGNLPTLVTDDQALRRIYYMSAVSLLSVLRTSFPHVPRAYTSNSPEFNCIGLYYWDARELGLTLAMLDPAMLKRFVSDCLALDIHSSNFQEFLTGHARGLWYSANDMSVFMLINDYLNVTGDRAFLHEQINGRKVIDHMEDLATYWRKLVRPTRILADYGGARNLLECVPTYINEVPSLNAGNVWMMRRVAELRTADGDRAAAERLMKQADALQAAVLELYEPGKGVWSSLHRDGTRVEMRHVLDFATIGMTIPESLTPTMRDEMTSFVKKELLTDHWMRAQSLSDPAAGKSDRPDHGPKGAFSAWPAETFRVFCNFGQWDLALDFLRRIAPVTAEGPFSQSRELLGTSNDAPVRIALRGWQAYNATSGVGFIDAIVAGLFQWHPNILGTAPVHPPTGTPWTGKLLNVPSDACWIDITCTPSGRTVKIKRGN